MNSSGRTILLLAFIALSLWRLAGYLRAGLARRARPGIPGVAGSFIPDPTVTAPRRDAAAPSGTLRARLAAAATAGAVWMAGNLAVWGVLFGVPALQPVPVFWRLLVGILGNFALLRLAHAAGAKVSGRAEPGAPPPGNNPIS